jgi:N-acetylglucosamine-6-phosphate deacetylase
LYQELQHQHPGIKNGIIAYAGKTRPQETYEKEWKAPEGSYALPGMIDIHIHGGYLYTKKSVSDDFFFCYDVRTAD